MAARPGRLQCHRRNGYNWLSKQLELQFSLCAFVAQPEEHKKNSDDHSQDPDEIVDWKGLWRPSSIDEAGSLLIRQLRLQDRCCEEQASK